MTAQHAYCTVGGMELEDQILSLLEVGSRPVEIRTQLDISRDKYYQVVSSLEHVGVLSPFGALPPDAVAEVWPPIEMASLFRSSSWSEGVMNNIRILCARYGWTEPSNLDDRYDLSKWTGQAVRRVDFEVNGKHYMCVGFLNPKIDKRVRSRSAPKYRTVYIESPHLQISWIRERGRIISVSSVDDYMSALFVKSTDVLVPLTLAAAWVCESRAIVKGTSNG